MHLLVHQVVPLVQQVQARQQPDRLVPPPAVLVVCRSEQLLVDQRQHVDVEDLGPGLLEPRPLRRGDQEAALQQRGLWIGLAEHGNSLGITDTKPLTHHTPARGADRWSGMDGVATQAPSQADRPWTSEDSGSRLHARRSRARATGSDRGQSVGCRRDFLREAPRAALGGGALPLRRALPALVRSTLPSLQRPHSGRRAAGPPVLTPRGGRPILGPRSPSLRTGLPTLFLLAALSCRPDHGPQFRYGSPGAPDTAPPGDSEADSDTDADADTDPAKDCPWDCVLSEFCEDWDPKFSCGDEILVCCFSVGKV